jgi:hypothetical protein
MSFRCGQKFKNQLKSKIRFLKKSGGWPEPGFQKHPGPARTARVPILLISSNLEGIAFPCENL